MSNTLNNLNVLMKLLQNTKNSKPKNSKPKNSKPEIIEMTEVAKDTWARKES